MSEPTRGIARAASVVAIGILLSRILGFARNVVLANRLGNSPAADAYEAAFIVPDFLNYLLAGGFLAITFIPIISRHLAADDPSRARASFRAVFGPVATLIVGLTAVAVIAADPLVGLLFGSGDRLDQAQLAEVVRLTRLVLPAQIFFVIGGLFTAVQYAHGKFLVPTLAPIIYNLGIIAGGLVGTWAGEPSPTGFIVGAVVGASVGNFALQGWGAARLGYRPRFGRPDFRHPCFKEYFWLAFPLMVGQSIVVLDESLGKVVAAAASDGSIFGLNLARRVNMVPVGVIGQAAGVAAFPYLALLVAKGRHAEMREAMGRTIRTVVFASGAAVAAVLAVSQPAVRVAFQHGAFDEDGTVLVAAALIGYSLGIPAWGIHQLFARSFYAHRQMWVPVVAGTIWVLPAIPVYLIGYRIGDVPGIAVASSIVITGHAVTMWLLWLRQHGSDGLQGMPATVGRAGLGSLVAGGAGWLVSRGLTGGAIPDLETGILAAVVGGVVVVALYWVTTFLAGAPEARAVFRRR
ncbi:MAG: murein biosynthesis integral membrane protein MurJ [Acidimicrobiia bacterium]|nr:murein biosynthesis integral membrane protein MurJ [Acidimicrobiia bacterium]